jgi:hypothetical protein
MKNKTEKKEPQYVIREIRTEPCRCVQDAARSTVKWLIVSVVAIAAAAAAVCIIWSWVVALSGGVFVKNATARQEAMSCVVILSGIIAAAVGLVSACCGIRSAWDWANKRR